MPYASHLMKFTNWECDFCHKVEQTKNFYSEITSDPTKPAGWLVLKYAAEAFHKENLVFCEWECLNNYTQDFKRETDEAIKRVFEEAEW